MGTILLIISLSLIALMVVAVYACFIVSGQCTRAEEKAQGMEDQQKSSNDTIQIIES